MSINFEKTISKRVDKTLSDQVKGHLRRRILSHEWAAGSKIPGEFQFAEQYNVARITIRSALRALENQGLIDIRHGSGTYIADFGDSIRTGLQQLSSVSQIIQDMGFKAGITTRFNEIRKPNEREAKLLQISEDSNVLTVERAISADDETVAYVYGTFKIDDIPKSVIKNMSKGPVLKALDSIGKHPVRARAEIHAVSSNEIGWGKDRPRSGLYLQLSQVFFLRDGSPIFMADDYYVEGRFQFLIFRTI